MIEYDDRDQIPAFLLPSSHSGQKSIAERRFRGSYLGAWSVYAHGAAADAEARLRHLMSPISPPMEAHA
jgi:hypothetical protein